MHGRRIAHALMIGFLDLKTLERRSGLGSKTSLPAPTNKNALKHVCASLALFLSLSCFSLRFFPPLLFPKPANFKTPTNSTNTTGAATCGWQLGSDASGIMLAVGRPPEVHAPSKQAHRNGEERIRKQLCVFNSLRIQKRLGNPCNSTIREETV